SFMRRSIARRRSKKFANQSTRKSPLEIATTITSVLSIRDLPGNAIAVLTGIVKVRLVNSPSADAAVSAANAVMAQAASAATIRTIFILTPLMLRWARLGTLWLRARGTHG